MRVGEVVGIFSYPLTGARANALNSVDLNAAGVPDNRRYVAYAQHPTKGIVRVSQKQRPQLARLNASIRYDGGLYAARQAEAEGAEPQTLIVPAVARASLVNVVEFGDVTPCHDMGDEAAGELSRLLQADVRLARKTDEWMAGEGMPPADRAVAPLHVVVTNSVDSLQDPSRGIQFGPDRLRPTILIRGNEDFVPLRENTWVGRHLLIGAAALIPIHRPTVRCSVPSLDQATGANMKDVARLYPELPKSEGLPVLGVYGYPELPDRVRSMPICIGDTVELI